MKQNKVIQALMTLSNCSVITNEQISSVEVSHTNIDNEKCLHDKE